MTDRQTDRQTDSQSGNGAYGTSHFYVHNLTCECHIVNQPLGVFVFGLGTISRQELR